MSIQDMTRFVGILTLDHRKLAQFLPVDKNGNRLPVDGDGKPVNAKGKPIKAKDYNKKSRKKMINAFYPPFDKDLEVPILQTGNMTTIFDYIFETAPRPVPDVDQGQGGG